MVQKNADHYRMRARELRAAASERSDEVARAVLLNVAEQCEGRARDLELRGILKLPGDPATAH